MKDKTSIEGCSAYSRCTARRIHCGLHVRRVVMEQHKDLVMKGSHGRGGAMATAWRAAPLHSRGCFAAPGCHHQSKPQPSACSRGSRLGAAGFISPLCSVKLAEPLPEPTPHQIGNLRELTAKNDIQHISQCQNSQTSDSSHPWMLCFKKSIPSLSDDNMPARLLSSLLRLSSEQRAN